MDLAFPYRIDPVGRTGQAPDRAAHVRDLVEQVLFTAPGERVMRPTFGSGLAQLVFQPARAELATAVELLVQGNLQQWLGDVIAVESVEVTTDDATLTVQVRYVEARTGEQRSETFTRDRRP